MRIRIIFFFLILLIGCSSTKETFKDSTFEKTTYKRDIDTTLKALNPLQGLAVSGNFYDPIKIKTKYYTFESEVNLETGIRTYNLTPAKDSIKVKIKVKDRVEKTTKTKTEQTTKKRSKPLYLYLLAGGVVLVGVVLLKHKLKS